MHEYDYHNNAEQMNKITKNNTVREAKYVFRLPYECDLRCAAII